MKSGQHNETEAESKQVHMSIRTIKMDNNNCVHIWWMHKWVFHMEHHHLTLGNVCFAQKVVMPNTAMSAMIEAQASRHINYYNLLYE